MLNLFLISPFFPISWSFLFDYHQKFQAFFLKKEKIFFSPTIVYNDGWKLIDWGVTVELFIFILLLSLMSFSVAFLVYGFCLRFFGASGTKSKIAQWTLTPLVVILWNLLSLRAMTFPAHLGRPPHGRPCSLCHLLQSKAWPRRRTGTARVHWETDQCQVLEAQGKNPQTGRSKAGAAGKEQIRGSL